MKHTEAINLLQKELELSMHLSAYPQDAYRGQTQEIDTLANISSKHRQRVTELKASIETLTADKHIELLKTNKYVN